MELQIVLDRDADAPLYRQIARQIREAISFKTLLPAEQLPTLHALALLAHVNLHTVRQAYQVLKREGILTIIQGKGAFVSVLENCSKSVKASVGWLKNKIDGLFHEAKREGLLVPEVDSLLIKLEQLLFPSIK